MNTVEELFGSAADLKGCAPALLHSVVDRLTVEEETRGVEVSLRCGELLTTNRTSHHFRQDLHLLNLRYFYFMNSSIVCQLEGYL